MFNGTWLISRSVPVHLVLDKLFLDNSTIWIMSYVMSFDSGIDFCTLFQVSSTRLIRYVNSSMVPDIDFGSIQNWMYEYLYIWCSLLKISLLPLTVALLHFLIISQCPRLIFFKFRTCSIVFKQVVFFLEECEYIHILILRNCH